MLLYSVWHVKHIHIYVYDRSSIPFAYFPLEMHMGHFQTLISKINDEYCFQTNSMRIWYISEVQFVIGIGLMAENP